MFAIAVELLTGRYTATQFNDRSQAEWPPHPARLFSAMVAAWADNDEPDASERSALRWLEDQDPPTLRFARGHRRTVVTHYVPVNDATALARDMSSSYRAITAAQKTLREAQTHGDARGIQKARTALVKAEAKASADASKAGALTGRENAKVLQLLPENRGKQGRTYPSVLPEGPGVWFIWPEAEPTEEQFQLIDDVLGRVGRIGHSSTLVSCRALREAPTPTLIPGARGSGFRLRVPRTGSMSALEDAYAIHRGEEPRTLPAGMVNYGRPGADVQDIRSPLLAGDWYVFGIRGRRLPNAVRSLAITRAARNALLAHGDQPSPAFLSGHQEPRRAGEVTPPLEQPHLAIVPLINAGNPHSDGTVFGFAFVLPADCGVNDKVMLEKALSSWEKDGFPLTLPGPNPARLGLEYLGGDRTQPADGALDSSLSRRRRATTRGYWCRAARLWATITPIALDRFPGDLRSADPRKRDRAEAEAIESVSRACVFAGLADAPEEVNVTIQLDAPLVGVPASPAGRPHAGSRWYPGFRTGGGTPRACVHAEIEFAQPVYGPVLIGAGRYLGYGLCLPRPEGTDEG